MTNERTYPIKVVAHRTGLTAHAIRAWEKRYGAVEPVRTPTNRRVYTEEHLERLLLLARATRGGYSIGQVAKLPTEKLVELVRELGGDAAPAPRTAGDEVPSAASLAPEVHLEACVEAVERLDGTALQNALHGASIALTQPVLLDDVVLPLMHVVGERWHSGTLRVAQEHLATAAVVAFLSGLIRASSPPAAAPVLVVTTPVGQRHEIGAMAASLVALADGWNVSYLGPDLPAGEIAAAATMGKARAVALGIVYPADDPRVAEQIRELGSLLPEGVTLIAGGKAVPGYAKALSGAGALMADSMADLRRKLGELRGAGAS